VHYDILGAEGKTANMFSSLSVSAFDIIEKFNYRNEEVEI
jgi:hypothetical protein